MDNAKLQMLKETAKNIRLGILEGVHAAASGHPGGSLSIADIMTYLYFSEMNVNPADPKNPDRDRLVLSKGHTAPALYATLAERGFFEKEELQKKTQEESYVLAEAVSMTEDDIIEYLISTGVEVEEREQY